MLDALRFVATAVAKKDFVPALTHYKIKDGRVTGFNGVISLSSPIDVDLEVLPHAASLLAAIRACQGTISLNMTPTGKLAVKSGRFKSFVECLGQDDAVWVEPEGTVVELGPQFLPGIKATAPAMGIDASRPWAMGIKLRRQSMFATNNVILTEYWHGAEIPLDVVIPSVAIDELLRIDENPTTVKVTDRSITFTFAGDRWLRSSLVDSSQWPADDLLERIFASSKGPQLPISPDFFEAVETLGPFIGDRGALYLSPSLMATSKEEGEGASVEINIAGMTGLQAYHQKHLALLGQLAKTIDWTAYPAPCSFQNDRLRGALVGQRL